MKLVAVGVNSTTKKCCLIYTYVPYDELEKNCSAYAKQYDQTNWGGCDDLARTLEKRNLKLTGKSFPYCGTNSGEDYDCGHHYGYSFTYDTIYEIKFKNKKQEDENNSAINISDYLTCLIDKLRKSAIDEAIKNKDINSLIELNDALEKSDYNY